MKIRRLLINLCSSDLVKSKNFYTTLFDFRIDYESDWFVNLVSEGRDLEIGIIEADHELVPEAFRGKPSGVFLTLVVDDAAAVFEIAKGMGVEVVEEPKLTFYGQKRVLLKDPDGVLVDVSSPESA